MLNLIEKASAAVTNNQLPTINVLASNQNVIALIVRILNWILIFAAVIAAVFMIIGGVTYLTAGGNTEQAGKGRTTLVNAAIGIAIIIISLVIIRFVSDLITTNAPTTL